MLKHLLTTFIILCSFSVLASQIIFGKVIRVADGDTLTLLDENNQQYRIRFHGIDCPEKGQDFYNVAKEFTKSKTQNQIIRVEITSKDRYGRYIGVVLLENNDNLNLQLIQEGLAWQATKFDNSKLFRNAQEKAKDSKKNIWSLKDPIAPWDFRKNKSLKKSSI